MADVQHFNLFLFFQHAQYPVTMPRPSPDGK
jgi:hypothetical protein